MKFKYLQRALTILLAANCALSVSPVGSPAEGLDRRPIVDGYRAPSPCLRDFQASVLPGQKAVLETAAAVAEERSKAHLLSPPGDSR